MKKEKLTAIGLQTVVKMIETKINDMPLGFSYGRDSNNTPLLKLITPNLMKIGRLKSSYRWSY